MAGLLVIATMASIIALTLLPVWPVCRIMERTDWPEGVGAMLLIFAWIAEIGLVIEIFERTQG